MHNLSPEKWKDLQDFEGLYQISTFGIIKSLTRIQRGRSRFIKEKILIGKINSKGYSQANLTKNGVFFQPLVSRLVAIHFIGPPPSSESEANHIDGNKRNNHYTNIEWLSHQKNVEHSILNRLRDYKNSPLSKRVLDTLNNEVYDSLTAVSIKFGFSKPLLSMKLSGKRKNNTPFRYL